MKITRYAQSCALIETNNKKILVDPGSINFTQELIEKWKCDLILITHKHGDHCHPEAISQFKVPKYASKEVADTFPDLDFSIVKEGETITLDDISIKVVKGVHGYIPWLKGEYEIHENIGFIIEGEKKMYFTSDSICFKNEYTCDILFVPVSNHGLVMSPFEAGLFARETKAKLVIPNHYDNPKYPVDLDKVREEFEKQNIPYKILGYGETIEV